jgi:hypothetical protein
MVDSATAPLTRCRPGRAIANRQEEQRHGTKNARRETLFARAAEAEQLAALAEDDDFKCQYGQLARAWHLLARKAEFLADLNALLKAPGTAAWTQSRR